MDGLIICGECNFGHYVEDMRGETCERCAITLGQWLWRYQWAFNPLNGKLPWTDPVEREKHTLLNAVAIQRERLKESSS